MPVPRAGGGGEAIIHFQEHLNQGKLLEALLGTDVSVSLVPRFWQSRGLFGELVHHGFLRQNNIAPSSEPCSCPQPSSSVPSPPSPGLGRGWAGTPEVTSALKLVAVQGGLCLLRVFSELLFIYDALGKQLPAATKKPRERPPFLLLAGKRGGGAGTHPGRGTGRWGDGDGEMGIWGQGYGDGDGSLSFAHHCSSHQKGRSRQTTSPDPSSLCCFGRNRWPWLYLRFSASRLSQRILPASPPPSSVPAGSQPFGSSPPLPPPRAFPVLPGGLPNPAPKSDEAAGEEHMPPPFPCCQACIIAWGH